MYLAGEAAHETLWGTVDGAWESGERAAEAALRRIGALPEIEPDAGTGAEAARRRRRRAGSDRSQSTEAAAKGADLLVERQG